MGEKMKMIRIIVISTLLTALYLGAQQEIRIRISEGVSMIPVAMPAVTFTDQSTVKEEAVRTEIDDTLWTDLELSRVFRMVPREHYGYIETFDPQNIRFRDWESIQANILISCQVEMPEASRIVMAFRVYDVRNGGRFIFGRNFGGKREFARLIAHRAADEMMKQFGETPLFTSKIVFVSNRDGNEEIYMMDYDGRRQRRITINTWMDVLPSWSRDHEKILFTSYRNNNPDLLMFHLYTGKTEFLSKQRANYCADWAPESNHIVYTSTKSGNAELYVRDMDTGRERRLTFNLVIDTTPNWSPSGREIAFTSARTGTPQIYIMDAEGTNVRRLTTEGNYHDSPEWSPDGTRIAFVSRIENRFDIFIYHVRTNSITKLTENAGRNENPSWSPDGRHIVFTSNRSGSHQLYLMDYDGANLKRLTNTGENKMPKWQKFTHRRFDN